MKKVGTNSLIWECDILLLIVINPLFNLLCIVTNSNYKFTDSGTAYCKAISHQLPSRDRKLAPALTTR